MTSPVYSFVCKDLLDAISDAEDFEKNSIYAKVMCGKKLENSGVKEKTMAKAIDRLQDLGLTESEIDFYWKFYETHGKPRCCLPAGHKGACQHLIGSYYADNFINKFFDCTQAPGADDVIFKNRIARFFGVQLTKENESTLRKMYGLKQKKKYKAAIPVHQAGTGFTCATAAFDLASLTTLQYGIEYKKNFSDDVLEAYKKHAQYLVNYYKTEYNMTIVDDEGYLCDPWSLERLQPDWWNTDELDNFNQIQFGHVFPVVSNRYMTRGLNILPLTRETNSAQNKRSFPEFVQRQKELAAKH
jgi:hypothetical protein